MAAMQSYEYIIVGAGSAGCTLANRLTADGHTSVMLLEAGGWDHDPWIKIPLGWGRILTRRLHDWMYFTEPEPRLANRRIECARGRVIGGSSSINAMAYVRGHASDYARWADAGCTGWSFADVLPYFKRQESWAGGADAYRGDSGPLSTQFSRFADPAVDAYFEAAEAAGYPRTADYNGAQQEGFAVLQSTIRDGRRCSAADAYLRPALARANLDLATRTLVTRVRFEGRRAVGVECVRAGEVREIRAAREVLLCGGTINSPQLLMLSGIGDPDALGRHDIPVKVAVPGVGRNLQDHWSVCVDYVSRHPGPLQRHMRLDRLAGTLASCYFAGTGFATDLPSGQTAFLKSDPSRKVPDLQLLFRCGSMAAAPWLPPFKAPFVDGFAQRVVLLRPESRGSVTLASADAAQAPLIRQNALAGEAEWRTLRRGVRMMVELGQSRQLAPLIEKQIQPASANPSDAEIDAMIASTAITVHHPLGTAKMGPATDPDAVVDTELRVRGVDGLRVIDASVMPDLVGGNINAVVIMIAERAADLLAGVAPLQASAPTLDNSRRLA